MEHFREIVIQIINSPLLYILTLVVLFILLKTGLLSVDTNIVRLGKTRENERAILAAQISYLSLHFGAISTKMVKERNDINPYHIKYTIEKLHDEMVRRCAINHISNDPIYEQDTYLTLIDIVRKRAGDDYFWSTDFEQFVKDEVRTMLIQLLNIRNRMNK